MPLFSTGHQIKAEAVVRWSCSAADVYFQCVCEIVKQYHAYIYRVFIDIHFYLPLILSPSLDGQYIVVMIMCVSICMGVHIDLTKPSYPGLISPMV